VLKILGGDKRVEKLGTILTFIDSDLATCATEHAIDIERLPEGYIEVGPGMVPTSSSTHMFGWRIGQKALKNHWCELILFELFALRQKII
jgi:hypothetical protein